MILLLGHFKIIENIKDWWLKIIVGKKLNRRKKHLDRKNIELMNKWELNIQDCPNVNVKNKKYVKEKESNDMEKAPRTRNAILHQTFQSHIWPWEKYYIEMDIKRKSKMLISN